MRKPESISDVLSFAFSKKRIEPEKRVKDLDHVPRGGRNRAVEPRHVWHRYEIKGGITAAQLMAENVTRNNSMLRKLMARNA